MEPDCVGALRRSLGVSDHAEFSPQDLSVLYRKVFHVPSNNDEAHTAMEKIAGGDSGWSCGGENVLDVLLEMEKERQKKERLYWDLQLLNVGNGPIIIDPQSTGMETGKKVCVQSCTFNNGGLQRNSSVMLVKRFKKEARQSWARLASEGVQSMLSPRLRRGKSSGVISQAWGSVTLSDILLLVEVKYDVVTSFLYAEMLQEQHTLCIWETMQPWQRRKEEEELEDLAEEALESGDMISLAELPGAFRMYRSPAPESGERCWSAVSLLCELHTHRQKEMDTLTVLRQRLDGRSLALLCLCIRLATLRAQRERMSYGALLAAQQSWETWPHVQSPRRADQAALWLHSGEEEQDLTSASPVGPSPVGPSQQAVLQLLVLTQEQERKCLLNLLHGVSLEDLQGPCSRVPPKEDGREQAALRNGCVERLRQIHAGLQTHGETHGETQTDPQSLHQLDQCFLVLFIQLMELQEVQAFTALQALRDKDRFEPELPAQRFVNLLQLLISDAPPTSGFTLTPGANVTEKSSNEPPSAQSGCSGPADSIRSGTGEPDGRQTADVTDRRDLCTGCGAAMEDLPYLEILCVSDETGRAEGDARVDDDGSATQSPRSYEKQGSLIALAWSKPPEDSSDCESEAAARGQEVESGLTTQVLPSDTSLACERTPCESRRDPDLRPTGYPDAVRQFTPEEAARDDPPAAVSDRPPHALVETQQDEQPRVPFDSGRLPSGPTNDTALEEREVTEVEMYPTAPELWDQNYNSDATVERESTAVQRERAGEPVSAMERERTMRNLVDMQRKVEQRQQRDRERQLLRVQERLSIVQNRKAEEDLLGLGHTERLRHLTQDLPQEDRNQQKTVVRERLEQLRRERSYVMQSKRERNTAGFKELLGPVTLHSREPDDGAD